MSKSFHAVLLGLIAVLLSSCAGGKLTSPEEERDGLTFAAKPNMARVYLIHGTTKNTDGPEQFVFVPGGIRGVVLAAAAGVHAAMEQARPPTPFDPTDPENKHTHYNDGVREEYYLNDQKIGAIDTDQYMAVDLAPGRYAIKAISVTPSKREVLDTISLTVEAGQVKYLYSSVSVGASYHSGELAECDERCQQLVYAGHRVAVR